MITIGKVQPWETDSDCFNPPVEEGSGEAPQFWTPPPRAIETEWLNGKKDLRTSVYDQQSELAKRILENPKATFYDAPAGAPIIQSL
jgi:hypothetical protein